LARAVGLCARVDPALAAGPAPPPTPAAGIAMSGIGSPTPAGAPLEHESQQQAWPAPEPSIGKFAAPSTPASDEVIDIRTYERPGAAGLVSGHPLRHAGGTRP